jgi:Flp pilus assembly protein CpaB
MAAMRVVLLAVLGASVSPAACTMVNLTAAQIMVGAPFTPLMLTAAEMLADQVFQRTGLRWAIVNATSRSHGVIHLSAHSPLEVDRASPKAEGYTVIVNVSDAGPVVTVTGTDGRGVLCVFPRAIPSLSFEVYHSLIALIALSSDFTSNVAANSRVRH